VTDANVVLGYLAPEMFLGGRRELRADLAHQAVETHVADPLALDVVAAAAGIVRVVNTNMVAAIRAMSIERGIDPRGFTLVCGGGAGGLHAAQIATELSIKKVVVPREAGTFCAFGMTVTDVRHDYVKALHAISSSVEPGDVTVLFAELEGRGRERLLGEGFREAEIGLERAVDARYPGQVHELTISLPRPDGPYGPADIREVERIFHAEHERQFSYSRPELDVELLHWRVSAVGRMPLAGRAVDASQDSAGPTVRLGERNVYIHASGSLRPVPVYSAEALGAGAQLSGPAIIAGATTTIVLNPGDELSCSRDSFLIDVGAGTRGHEALVAAPAVG
jgi:N-methylhydantoinase A